MSNNGDASPGTPKEYQKPAWARRGEDEALKKAKSILNKLTLEKFDRLSEEFVNLDLDSVDLVAGAIDLIVKKAQRETHFVDIYAELCVKLAATPLAGLGETEKGKKFRKLLLERCQAEFERDDEALVAEINGISDDAEREARITSIRKIYIGHIFFIGALYKQELLRETIMHHCVQELFGDPDEPDDEKIECLSKLMMSVGKQLDAAALEKKESQRFMKAYFKQLKKLTKSDKLATRIRFLVRDLCDLRDNDWKPRREVEQAKTIAEIHEDAQREADVKAGKKPTARKVERAGNTVSDDGWETVGKSVPAASKSGSRYGSRNAAVEKASPDPVPAASGAFGAFASLSSSKEKKKKKKKDEKEVKQPKKKSSSSTAAAPPTAPAPEVDETKYRAKAKAAVQEYLSIEQIDEVVSCLEELNGPRSLFVSQALDCMLNCKERDRAKVGPLLGQLAKRNVLSPDDFAKGFLDILQILPDIIIDMPKANYWLGDALITLVKDGALNLDFVTKDVPEPIAQGGDDYVKVWDDFKAYVVNGCDA